MAQSNQHMSMFHEASAGVTNCCVTLPFLTALQGRRGEGVWLSVSYTDYSMHTAMCILRLTIVCIMEYIIISLPQSVDFIADDLVTDIVEYTACDTY